MKNSEITQFRKEFASIVYWKGMINSQKRNVGTVTRFDKNGSHKNATLKSINILNDYREKFELKLKGKSYEEWAEMSKKISQIKNKINKSVTARSKQKWQEALDSLSWNDVKPKMVELKGKHKIIFSNTDEITVEDMKYIKKTT